MTKHFLLFVIYALCTYRLSTMLVLDEIAAKLRTRIIEWATRHKHGWLKTWIGCVWCVSVWVGAGVVLLGRFGGSWAVYPCAALAFSAVAGFLSDRESQ